MPIQRRSSASARPSETMRPGAESRCRRGVGRTGVTCVPTTEARQRKEQRGQVGEGHSPLPSFSSPVVWGWQQSARCLGQEQFLSDDEEDQAKALALCDACPVLAECQAYTRAAKPTFGVWAGHRYSFHGRPNR